MKVILQYILILIFGGFSSFEKERQVNTFTKSYQREPVIAINKTNGNYIIVWTSNEQDGDKEGIFAQYFDKNDSKIRNEFQVNTTTSDNQNKPAVDMNSSGKCIIVWASTKPDSTLQDIYGQLFDENGNRIDSEFKINSTVLESQNCPDVAMDNEGNFVVVWHSWDQDGGDRGIFGQQFRSDGSKIGNEFLVNTYTPYSQAEPSIGMTPDGKFAVAWQSWKQEKPSKNDYGVYAQIFNADASKYGNEIHVNTTIDYDQFYPDIALSDTGNFLITWTSWIPYNPNDPHAKPYYSEIFAQRFDSKGNKIGAEFQVNTTMLEYQWLSAVALDIDGSFVITWSSWKQDGDRESVNIQFFNPEGSKNGKEQQVNYYTSSYQWEPQIVKSGRNEVIAVWSSWGQDGDDYGVFCKRISR